MMANAITAAINKSTPEWIVAKLGKPTNDLPTIHVEKLREAKTYDEDGAPITMLVTAESITVHSLGEWLASDMRETMFVKAKLDNPVNALIAHDGWDEAFIDIEESRDGDEWLHEPSHERMVSRS